MVAAYSRLKAATVAAYSHFLYAQTDDVLRRQFFCAPLADPFMATTIPFRYKG